MLKACGRGCREGSGCRTLITSRFGDFPELEGFSVIQPNMLGSEAARHFLVTRTIRAAEGAERAACDALAKALGYLPLALEQAAAYIAAPGTGLTFLHWRRRCRDRFVAARQDSAGSGSAELRRQSRRLGERRP